MSGREIIRGVIWKPVLWLVIALLSIKLGFYAQTVMLGGIEDVVNAVITIFSILAGFLIAIITLLPESILTRAEDWKELTLMKPTVEGNLRLCQFLFYLYLVILGAAVFMLLDPAPLANFLDKVQGVFFGLVFFTFVLSFCLPVLLVRIQLDRYGDEVEKKEPKGITRAKKIAQK